MGREVVSDFREWLTAGGDEPEPDPEEEAFVARLRDDEFGWLDDYVAEKHGVEGGGDAIRKQYYRVRRQ
jgi:hypothetical protein